MSVLGALVYTAPVSAAWANVVATTAGTVPSFELNRRWVWAKAGRRSIWSEIVPFAALSFAGLVLSTIAVAAATHTATKLGYSDSARTAVAEVANIAAFGSLWLVQFMLLDRVLFRPAVDRVADLKVSVP
jgi:putative flippase GtrA